MSEDKQFLIESAETCEKAALILRAMAAEDVSENVTGYTVDAPSSLPVISGTTAILHIEPQDWPKGDGDERTAEAAHATHKWNVNQSCDNCGMPHPVFIHQEWPACPAAAT